MSLSKVSRLFLSALLIACSQCALADDGPPLKIVSPGSGANLNGNDKVQIKLFIDSSAHIESVQVTCDDVPVGLVNPKSPSLLWQPGGLRVGRHVLQAIGQVKGGDPVKADSVEINVATAGAPVRSLFDGYQPGFEQPKGNVSSQPASQGFPGGKTQSNNQGFPGGQPPNQGFPGGRPQASNQGFPGGQNQGRSQGFPGGNPQSRFPGSNPPGSHNGPRVAEGVPVILVTEDFMKSGETKTGTPVRLHVDKDVIGPNGGILIPAGSHALGEVVKSEGHGLFGKAGKLDFSIKSVEGADGTSVPLRAMRNAAANDSTTGVIIGAVLLSPLILLFNGSNVEVPAGTILTAYVDRDTVIARPAKARFDAQTLHAMRTVNITFPADGSEIEKPDKISVMSTISPNDDEAYTRLYLDEKYVAGQRGAPGYVEWKGADKSEDGPHTMYSEVTFSTGHVVRSPVVHFRFK